LKIKRYNRRENILISFVRLKMQKEERKREKKTKKKNSYSCHAVQKVQIINNAIYVINKKNEIIHKLIWD